MQIILKPPFQIAAAQTAITNPFLVSTHLTSPQNQDPQMNQSRGCAIMRPPSKGQRDTPLKRHFRILEMR